MYETCFMVAWLKCLVLIELMRCENGMVGNGMYINEFVNGKSFMDESLNIKLESV